MASITKISQAVINCLNNNKKVIAKTSDITSSAVSYGVGKAVRFATAIPNEVACRVDMKISDKFYSNPEYSKIANNIADDVLERTNLAKKGVKIYDINLKNLNSFEACDAENAAILEQVALGKNAQFNNEKINLMNGKFIEPNSILINREKMAPTLLHELGHADNFNNSPFLGFVAKAAYMTSCVSSNMPKVAAATKNYTPKKASKASVLLSAQSVVHKLSPLISGITYLPTLIDEAMASKKAIKWAKEFGDEKFTKELTKNLISAYTTYATEFFSNIATTSAAKTSKDKMIQKIEDKFMH